MFKILVSLIIYTFFLIPAPVSAANIFTGEKLIAVDTGSQKLTAWENGKIVHETKVSTGMKLTPTVKGSFKIYNKIPLHDMRGPSPYKDIYPTGKYLVKNVPNSMYFYQGYAIHGAYWHNNFGRPASHGCVNVPLASAQWLFDWAQAGTRVEVW
jgi:lipoprotein-anchoring transpeptidase ErfK/SrfK